MKRREAGVTLMELLIAVSLVSLLSVAILMSMRTALNAMSRTNSKFLQSRRILGAQRILEQQIAGFIPVTIECVLGPVPGGPKTPFFHGEPHQMRFVTSYSMDEAARGYARIVEYRVIPGEEGRGVRLVVNERLYTGGKGAGTLCVGFGPNEATGIAGPRFAPVEVGPYSFVLADRLAYCRFVFRESLPAPVFERWLGNWIRPAWPAAIRVEMAPLESNNMRLQPVSLTLPMRVDREPLRLYED